jgi:four helix bundle protein
MTNERKIDIQERSIRFAIRAAKLVDRLPRKQSIFEYGKQLIRSSASVGANLQEADGALSRKDFLNKLGISRKEAKETYYWLILVKEVVDNASPDCLTELNWLLIESREIKLIISKIINNTKANAGIGN